MTTKSYNWWDAYNATWLDKSTKQYLNNRDSAQEMWINGTEQDVIMLRLLTSDDEEVIQQALRFRWRLLERCLPSEHLYDKMEADLRAGSTRRENEFERLRSLIAEKKSVKAFYEKTGSEAIISDLRNLFIHCIKCSDSIGKLNSDNEEAKGELSSLKLEMINYDWLLFCVTTSIAGHGHSIADTDEAKIAFPIEILHPKGVNWIESAMRHLPSTLKNTPLAADILSEVNTDHPTIEDLKSITGIALHEPVSDRDFESLTPFLVKVRKLSLSISSPTRLEWLSNLSRLTHFEITGAETSNISPLKKFNRTLKELHISSSEGSEIEGIAVLSSLTSLQSLILRGVSQKIVTELSDLHQIISLEIHSESVIDISAISLLSTLEQLTLEGGQIGDLSPLKSLHNLKQLSLNGVSQKAVESLSGLDQIQSLDIRSESVADISAVSSLTKLEELFLRGTQITDLSPVKNLHNLKELWIPGSNADVGPIRAMPNLNWTRNFA